MDIAEYVLSGQLVDAVIGDVIGRIVKGEQYSGV